MEYLLEYGLFLAKVITFVIAFIVVVAFSLSSAQRGGDRDNGRITVTKLNDRFDHMQQAIKEVAWSDKALKDESKRKKKEQKLEKKNKKPSEEEQESKRRVFVLDFDGDIKASATDELRESITAVMSIATSSDEVVLRLESPGGLVHAYGLAASQLARITKKDIPLTVCVDKVAASGGYMMACVANKILAAPFAVIGSIGVVAQLPNFHKILKKNDVDYEIYTAGEYKRTLTMLGENTEKGRQKFVEDLQDTHNLFKDFIADHRASVQLDDVATGEIWFGIRAQAKSLIDGISTSDEYLVECANDADVLLVEFEYKKTLQDRLGIGFSKAFDAVWSKVLGAVKLPYLS